MDTSTVANKSTGRAVRLATLSLAAGAFSLLGTVAMAQNSSVTQPSVTVTAPRVVHKSVSPSGLAIDQYSLTRRVSYADLNLDTAAGKAALHERIRVNATAACERLEALYPSMLWIDDVQSCVQHAMLTWMPVVHVTATTD